MRGGVVVWWCVGRALAVTCVCVEGQGERGREEGGGEGGSVNGDGIQCKSTVHTYMYMSTQGRHPCMKDSACPAKLPC